MVKKQDEIIKKLMEKYKLRPEEIGFGNDVLAHNIERISTGIFSLDVTSGGGIPIGRVSLIYGDEDTCKTTMCLRIAANAQNICSECKKPKFIHTCKTFKPFKVCYIDAENSITKNWAMLQGVNMNELILVRHSILEDVLNIMDDFIEKKLCNLFIIDSLAILEPKVEYDSPYEKFQQGLAARLFNKCFRKLQNSMHSSDMGFTFVFINQMRDKIVMFGDPSTTPGGRGQRFSSTLSIKLIRKKVKKTNKGEVLSRTFKFILEKNKLGVPFLEGMYLMHFSDLTRVFDNVSPIFETAKFYGYISKKDKKYMFLDKEFEQLDDIKKYIYDNEQEVGYKFGQLLIQNKQMVLNVVDKEDSLKSVMTLKELSENEEVEEIVGEDDIESVENEVI